MSQDAVFAATEADRWFERNRDALHSADLAHDIPLRLLELYGVCPTRALEIGGANGYRMAELARRTNAAVEVVEPSPAAIADGRQRYPHVTYHQGVAANLPTTTTFDLVVLNYVLHWVDRRSLLRTAAEIDRVADDNAYLLIGDFDPALPTRVRYHHLPERDVYTFKQDYAALFLATGLYQRVGALSGTGHSLDGSVDDDRRSVVTLLRRRPLGVHATATFSTGTLS